MTKSVEYAAMTAGYCVNRNDGLTFLIPIYSERKSLFGNKSEKKSEKTKDFFEQW